MHGSQKCYGKLAELRVDDIWQIADAGDQELRRLAHSSRRSTMEVTGNRLINEISFHAGIELNPGLPAW